MTEAIIQYLIYQHYGFKTVLPNVHTESWGGSEVDALYWTKSNRVYFFEIKLSRADLNADFKKKRHRRLLARDEGIKIKPKYFYYVCSGFDIIADEVPEYAGLILCEKYRLKVYPSPEKKAPVLWKEPITQENILFLNEKIQHRFLRLVYKPKQEEWHNLYMNRPGVSK